MTSEASPPSSLLPDAPQAGSPTNGGVPEGSSYAAMAIDSLCIGSGRFLRSVLVPALVAADYHPAIIQTRGRTFLDYCWREAGESPRTFWTYEVDTVHYDGQIETTHVPCWGAGTLGSPAGKKDILDLCLQLGHQDSAEPQKPFIIGVGVTEAGLASAKTKAMKDLYDILAVLSGRDVAQKICVINTDNVSSNGNLVREYMNELASTDYVTRQFLATSVVFHNTMVDRITSQRPGTNGLVPRAEPTPLKALVVEDLGGALPLSFSQERLRKECGVVVRRKKGELDADIALKLRVANGTHTAAAHAMALSGLTMTDVLSSETDEASLLMKYLDSFFDQQISKAVVAQGHASKTFTASQEEAQVVYDDWRRRLVHAHFGLSTFFITQNGAAKGGIRIGPSIKDLVSEEGGTITCSTAFAFAAILRWLTPAPPGATPAARSLFRGAPNGDMWRGWLDPKRKKPPKTMENGDGEKHIDKKSKGNGTEYADGLSYDIGEGTYEYRCALHIQTPQLNNNVTPLPEALAYIDSHPQTRESVVRCYLEHKEGGNLGDVSWFPAINDLVSAISVLYSRMVAGDGMLDILKGLDLQASCACLADGPRCFAEGSKGFDDSHPLHYRPASIPDDSELMKIPLRLASKDSREILSSMVISEVASAVAIDLHTHLLPPTHGALCLWGIDELLTYHYLVAEYFVTAPPSITPESFYALSKQRQADLIWQALFVDRSPISEACRGVLTTCVALGLAKELEQRDLEAIRKFYRGFRDRGLEGAEQFSKHVFERSGINYAVMTNIPFEPTETQHWRPTPKEYSKHFRSACRVDPLLAGNQTAVEQALKAAGYATTLEGARQFLHDWCDTMEPEYLMASTPHDFVLAEDKGTTGRVEASQKTGINEEAMKQPFAFANLVSRNTNAANSNDANASCTMDCGAGEELASVINEDSDFLSDVLMRVCSERDLPLALKIGAHRGVNPKLLQAGDGVVAFADASMLARLCTRFPKVRFLATFLSRANQHEACVLATKFRNLHLYGCWWFCNNPSIIEEISRMRVEMLGTAFTAQHSDSRVLDQLLYKWPHSRAILARVLIREYTKLLETGGWSPTRGEIRRDIRRWFGASYEEFLAKSLV